MTSQCKWSIANFNLKTAYTSPVKNLPMKEESVWLKH